MGRVIVLSFSLFFATIRPSETDESLVPSEWKQRTFRFLSKEFIQDCQDIRGIDNLIL
jgi:hypothetical protein